MADVSTLGDLTPLLQSLAAVGAAIVYGAAKFFETRLHLNQGAVDVINASLPRAIQYAETSIGHALDQSHLGDEPVKNEVLKLALSYLNMSVPQAVQRLQLTDSDQQAKIMAALAAHVHDSPRAILGEAVALAPQVVQIDHDQIATVAGAAAAAAVAHLRGAS